MSLKNRKIYSLFNFGTNKGVWLYDTPHVANVYYKNYSVDLITGIKRDFSIRSFHRQLSKVQLRNNKMTVFHLFYEYGHLLFDSLHSVKDDEILAIEIKYTRKRKFQHQLKKDNFQYKQTSKILFEIYKKAYERGRKHLLDGDCYQFNLTSDFNFSLSGRSSENFFKSFFRASNLLGAYAHGTYLDSLDKAFISNSPECLFQCLENKKSMKLWSMPIKGTAKRSGTWGKDWIRLKSSLKDNSELDMITDLIRNDLNRIDRPVAKVVKRYSPLIVPKIIHQYSLIQIDLQLNTSLQTLIDALFPGGSITGAPKKRVYGILKQLENKPRGFYCGSTILLDKDVVAASINIRSATLNLSTQTLQYNAGGGITLRSDLKEEFNEMLLKLESFKELLEAVRKQP